MFAKKVPVNFPAPKPFKTELEYLYARRVAIDTLIESLEQYDRCRAKRLDPRKRRTA